MSKDVAEKKEQGVAVYDYGDHAGSGFENHSKDDYSLPFLNVLQQMSPELENLEGAKAGMLYNSVTQELYKADTGLRFVPCYTQHCFVEWVPRASGGGLVGVHQLGSEAVLEMQNAGHRQGKFKMSNGNELIETFYVYGLQLDNDGNVVTNAVLAFASTKIKKYKAWMTKARTVQISLPDGRRINPPLFAHVFRLTTVKEKNAHGEFYNLNCTWDGEKADDCRLPPNSELFKAAVACKELVESGKAKADYSSAAQESASDEGGAGQGKAEPGAKRPF